MHILKVFYSLLPNILILFPDAMYTQTWLRCLLLKAHLFFSGSVFCINRNPTLIPRNYLSMERALEKQRKKNIMTSEWQYIYMFFHIACALILESSGKTLRLVIRHRDPINITCKHIQNIKEIIRVICVFVLKRQYILPPLRGVVTSEWCSCCIMFAVYAIPLSCYSPI